MFRSMYDITYKMSQCSIVRTRLHQNILTFTSKSLRHIFMKQLTSTTNYGYRQHNKHF